MADPLIKQKIHQACKLITNRKLETLRTEFRLYQESAANETKSTAGDKHDTGKAMMQMEQEKLGVQLKELLGHQKLLESVEGRPVSNKSIHPGSLVFTNHGIFYIAVPLGKLELEGLEVQVISMQSPLAKAISGKAINSLFEFNGRNYTIAEIA